jgi:glycosyltransferase involved in cell wall biosynthesis
VSVVIPAFNAGRWIAGTLDSVYAQTFRDFEVVVVDDGSDDNTAEVLAACERGVRYIRKDNGGENSARNAGVREARGRYVAFVDADDFWMAEKLEQQIKVLEVDSDRAWVYSDALIYEDDVAAIVGRIGRKTTLHSGDILEKLILSNFIAMSTSVVRRSAFDAVGAFDESLRQGGDWDMWLRLAAKYSAFVVDQPLTVYRRHLSSATGVMDLPRRLTDLFKVLDRALVLEPERLGPLKDRAVANLYAGHAQWLLRRGDISLAREAALQAVRSDPAGTRGAREWVASCMPRRLLQPALRLHRKCRARAHRSNPWNAIVQRLVASSG